MLWAVAGRFGFDGHDMPVSRLRFWYAGHVKMIDEERAAMEAAKRG
jgi:hypothetical protein